MLFKLVLYYWMQREKLLLKDHNFLKEKIKGKNTYTHATFILHIYRKINIHWGACIFFFWYVLVFFWAWGQYVYVLTIGMFVYYTYSFRLRLIVSFLFIYYFYCVLASFLFAVLSRGICSRFICSRGIFLPLGHLLQGHLF